MASSSYRRASHDAGPSNTANTTAISGRRTGSIDSGIAGSVAVNSRRPSSDANSACHVRATVVAQGPPVAFFGSCVLDDVLYIHGGVKTRGDHSPSNRMFKFQNNTWTELTTTNSPTLSYHRCLVMDDGKFIVAIGGWDGSKRTSDVHVYDVANAAWHHTHSSGFPTGGGLNNHAAIPLRTPETSILVLGRDGGLRTQRRHGDAYSLHGDPAKGIFRWNQYPIAMDSRSGHTLLGHASSLYIIGGRADHLIQRYPGVHVENPTSCNYFHSNLKHLIESKTLIPMKKPPATRKDHTSIICGPDLAIVYGGETFDGKSRDPTSDIFVLTLGSSEQWFNLGQIEFGRQGHAMVNLGQQLLVHGGLGKTGACGETFVIDLI